MYRPTNSQTETHQGGPAQMPQYGGQRISQAAPLPFEFEAKIDETSEKVTLVQTCDWQGHSPSYVGVDLKGKTFIASFGEVTVTDRRILPNPQVSQLNR